MSSRVRTEPSGRVPVATLSRSPLDARNDTLIAGRETVVDRAKHKPALASRLARPVLEPLQ